MAIKGRATTSETKKTKEELTLWMKVSPCTMRVLHK
jgi:hypothetical protein